MKALSTKRRAYAGLMRALMLFSVLLTGALVLFLIGYVLWKGIPNITWELLSTKPSYLRNQIGILPDILNTVYIVIATLLIVLPLVAVAAAGSALLYRKLLADAREMVQMRQEAVSSALTQDVRQASLQLAHFLLSEDSEGLALVDELPASSSRRYETAARLESIFDYYRLTGRRLEALHLYLTDGTSYQLYTGSRVVPRRPAEAGGGLCGCGGAGNAALRQKPARRSAADGGAPGGAGIWWERAGSGMPLF